MADGFTGKRVTVMGLGTRGGGVGVARFLAERGAIVTVTDGKTAEELTQPLSELDGLPIRYVLGGHEERDFTTAGADLVVRNPGVRRTSPMLRLAREFGVPIEMEMTLFFRLCPAPIIGITGTKGKTTTATLCAGMLSAWDERTVLAGNMGVSALAQLARITPETPVVIEVSNWQLEALDEHRLSPKFAVLTNISEDHLDTYDDFDDYAETKRSIARHQRPDDVLVVNADDPEAWEATSSAQAFVIPFGLHDRGRAGAWLSGDDLMIRDGEREETIAIPAHVRSGGEHLLANAAAAAAAAWLRGAPAEAIGRGLIGFRGVKDRNERVGEVAGVEYVNDTAATTPIATIAALRAYAGRTVHLIAGGSDKRVELAPLADAAADHAGSIYLLNGTATPRLVELLGRRGAAYSGPFDSMEAAVIAAAAAARPGEVVLLSPGCASFGLFRDEFDRGEQFRQAVRMLEAGQ
ncbi:MAG: UDP-N-acetylmuramoylalanine--D-glutamate ligase [Thermomicrobiales bacterium]|jgi:UDP-N-acetylmuramoylalanine--D-glutamate ligase|nr:UDP-N-acetylmuramoylalanine--D-glutamate ligase [Thermomicrobiales bacterium]